MRVFVVLFVSGICAFLVACSSSDAVSVLTPTSVPPTIETEINAEDTETQLSTPEKITNTKIDGETYLLLAPISPPFDEKQLVYFPSWCLIETVCPQYEILNGFPPNEFESLSEAPLSWSPDGKQALIFNAYTSQLLHFDSQNKTVRVLINQISLVSDQMVWAPNSQWVALPVQGDNAYTSIVTIIDPTSGRVQQTLEAEAGSMQFPLAWLNLRELMVQVYLYQPLVAGEPQKQIVTQTKLQRFDVQTKQLITQSENSAWLGQELVISPDDSQVVFSTNSSDAELLVVPIDGTPGRELSIFGMLPVWSPDGTWIATVLPIAEDELQIHVTRSNGEESWIVYQGPGYYAQLNWLAGNQYLLIRTISEQAKGENTALYLADIVTNQTKPVSIPAPEQNGLMIDGLSIQPVSKP